MTVIAEGAFLLTADGKPVNLEISDAQPHDKEWIKQVWDRRLGGFGLAWSWYWKQRELHFGAAADRQRWLVVRPVGFVHYYLRRDGWKTIHEIAVRREFRRTGVGRALLRAVEAPIRLTTDADNAESNEFYRREGFDLFDEKRSKKGKLMNIYIRREPW